jgi:hypothetical protein
LGGGDRLMQRMPGLNCVEWRIADTTLSNRPFGIEALRRARSRTNAMAEQSSTPKNDGEVADTRPADGVYSQVMWMTLGIWPSRQRNKMQIWD